MDLRKQNRLAASGQVLYSIGEIVLRDELYNLSLNGCMIAAQHAYARVGDKIEITLLKGVVATGTIAWSGEGAFGVQFDNPVSEATVRYFRLTDWTDFRSDPFPADSFGRTLPPLSGEFKTR